MSTAIALQDITTSQDKDTGTLRHRTTSQPHRNSALSSQDDDPWLQAPQDINSTKLPFDTRAFTPTRVYWIPPHGLLSKDIRVLDLTNDMDEPYIGMTDAYKAQIKKTLKDHSYTPVATCTRTNWLALKYNITDNQGNHIAHWSHPWTSVGEAIITFPQDSELCTHPISFKNKRWGFRTESFTVNSQLYVWEMDSIWHSTNMTLYKVFGTGEHQRKVIVGKYAQKFWGAFVTGGVFVVDARMQGGEGEESVGGLDGVVAALSLCVVLKKKRQRAGEKNHGGE